MPGNPFRVPPTDLSSTAESPRPRNENPLRAKKPKKVSFVSPPQSPEKPDSVPWDHDHSVVKSPPPNGGFGVDIKALLQSDGSDEIEVEHQVEAMMAQQQRQKAIETSSGRPPNVQFSGSQGVSGASQSGSQKMDVHAFTRMLMGEPSRQQTSKRPTTSGKIDGPDDDLEESHDDVQSISSDASTMSTDQTSTPAGDGDTVAQPTQVSVEAESSQLLSSDTTLQEPEVNISPSGQISNRSSRPPPPPATRRAMARALATSGQRSRSNSAQDRSASPQTGDRPSSAASQTSMTSQAFAPHVRTKEAPPPPLSRHAHRSDTQPPVADDEVSRPSSTGPSPAVSGPGPAPPPPPRRRKHDGRESRLASKHRLSYTDSSSSANNAPHLEKTTTAGGVDMLADLDALQREIDALRSKVG